MYHLAALIARAAESAAAAALEYFEIFPRL